MEDIPDKPEKKPLQQKQLTRQDQIERLRNLSKVIEEAKTRARLIQEVQELIKPKDV